jgi:hypothetical protein
MKNQNKELVTILSKLNSINFNNVDGKSVSNDEWKVVIRVNFLTFTNVTEGRIQLEIYAKYKGNVAMRWGSENAEQNDLIAEWFVRAESSAYRVEEKQKIQAEQIAQLAFHSL